MLLNVDFLASDRSRSENNRQSPIEMSRINGCSTLLTQPDELRGPAPRNPLVRRKLRSSLNGRFPHKRRSVIILYNLPTIALIMEPSYLRFALYAAAAAMVIALLMKLRRRLELSAAKYRSIEGHARMSRRLARLMPFYEYSQNQFFRTDNAPPEVEARRRQAFDSLAGCIGNGFQKPFKPRETPRGISDLQFISRYRVPFQFSRMVRDRLTSGSFLQSSDGVMVTDLDGNRFYDLAGSYGGQCIRLRFLQRMYRPGQ